MKIVIAPDSFKESLTAMEVATAIEAGFKQIYPAATYIKVPMADGGEGTVEALIAATHGRLVTVEVMGPLRTPVQAFWGLTGDGQCAVIEMAAASGLHHVAPELRNPLLTTSYGTGELILSALNHGVKKIILGIGGSATNDGGMGMMQALGAVFYRCDGEVLLYGGEALCELDRIDISGLNKRLAEIEIVVACDVDNPLCGDSGASAVFGPQKGANPEMIKQLDNALLHYGQLIEQCMNRHVCNIPGAGAAGGMGAALLGFLNAVLRPGIEIITEALKLDELVQDADLVVTGEGRVDSQSIHGKTPVGVAKVAKRYNKPVIVLAGSVSTDYEIVHQYGIDAVFSILNRICTLDEALQQGAENLIVTARNVAAIWQIATKR